MAANLRIIYQNLIDSATVTASSSASASLGVANLLTDIKSSVWRSIGTTARLDVLLASAGIVGGVALPFTNLSAAATMRVRMSNEAVATNLLRYPRNFDNAAWLPGSNAAQVAPNNSIGLDGYQTADTIAAVVAGDLRQQIITVPNNSSANSVTFILKQGTAAKSALYLVYSGGTQVSYLVTITWATNTIVDTFGNAAGYTLQNLGSGYYAAAVSGVNNGTGNTSLVCRLYPAGHPSFGGATGSVIVWHAQAEAGSKPSSVIPDATAFVSRASNKWEFNSAGVLTQYANDVAVTAYDPATLVSRGLSLEAAAMNFIRNSAMGGAVVGTPGTMPTNALLLLPSGLQREVKSVGTEDGIDYCEVRIFGAASLSGQINLSFETNGAAATIGQSFVQSKFVRVVGGALTGLSFRLTIDQKNSGGSFVTGGPELFITPTSAALRSQRYSAAPATITNATTATVTPIIYSPVSAGAAIDVTLRIGLPQLEQGAFPTSPIKTAGTAVTRAADISTSPQVTRPAGFIDAWQSYDYDSGYVVACPGGVRDVWGWQPAQLNVSSYAFGGGSCARAWMPRTTAKGIAIEISDPANPMGYIEAARLVVGDYWTPAKNADYGLQQTSVDGTTHERADDGSQRPTPGSRHNSLSLNMQWLGAADRAAFASILRRNGMLAPMFVSIYPNWSDGALEADNQVYGRLSSLGGLAAHMRGYHSAPLAIEEI